MRETRSNAAGSGALQETLPRGRQAWRLALAAGLLAAGACLRAAPGWLSQEHSTAIAGGGRLAAVVAAIAAAYQVAVWVAWRRVRARNGAPAETAMLSSLFRAVAGLAAVVAALHYSGALPGSWAVAGGFGGLLLGWSLQAPVSGLAAWALVSLKRPFRTGDRIMLPSFGLTGDVARICMMYTELNQVGGTVRSEDAAGRSILIPNAMLFGTVVINYTPQHAAAFVLDEVVVRVTYNSDWDTAERILLQAAAEVTGDIIQRTGFQPYVRGEMYDYGLHLFLRYKTSAKDRPRVVSEITKRIVHEFQRSQAVDFTMPYVYSNRTGSRMGTRRSESGADASPQAIPIESIRPGPVAGDAAEWNAEVAELRQRIAEAGLLQPIVVEENGEGSYNVVAGDRRLAACRELGWARIPCVVRRRAGRGVNAAAIDSAAHGRAGGDV